MPFSDELTWLLKLLASPRAWEQGGRLNPSLYPALQHEFQGNGFHCLLELGLRVAVF